MVGSANQANEPQAFRDFRCVVHAWPPTSAEIRSALLGLAEEAKVQLDWNCANDIAMDLQGDPAAMALARFMLLHLWEESIGGCIGVEAYRKLGSPTKRSIGWRRRLTQSFQRKRRTRRRGCS